MRAVVTMVLLPTAFALIAACAAGADEDADGAGADITASAAGCTTPDRSYSGPGKVTATTSGVRCYDDKGVVVGSMGAQASVSVVVGAKTGAANNPNRVEVTGTNTVDHKQLTCWMPTTYLCKTQSAPNGRPDAGAEAGVDAGAHSNEPPSIFCEYPVADGKRQAFIGDCRTVDGETSICLAPDEKSDARWVQFDPSKNKCSTTTTNVGGPPCGTSFSDNDCGASAATSFVAQCTSAGGVSKTVQPAVNGAIGAARCDCSCGP